ncbi:MAG TPA: hypothetical protein VN634_01395 [Candidatus Limnocylindrales bacterium]|nr:hypothetical protein [Candidatus Limnocylindrales bacterium]
MKSVRSAAFIPASVILAGALLAAMPAAAQPATQLSIDSRNPYLWTFDTSNADSQNFLMEITLEGHTVCYGNGLATQPTTGNLWAVLTIDNCNQSSAPRELVTIDPTTGIATDVGPLGTTQKVSSLAFGADSATIYVVTGLGGTDKHTLYQVDPANGELTQLCVAADLGNGDGHTLAYGDGTLYHATMNCNFGEGCATTFELIDTTNLPADPTDPCGGTLISSDDTFLEPTALMFVSSDGGNVTLLMANFTDLYTVEIPGTTGVDGVDITYVRTLSGDSKGLALTGADLVTADLIVTNGAQKFRNKGHRTIEYTLQAVNLGPDTVTGIVVTNPIPTGTTLVSSSIDCTEQFGSLVCDVGTLDPQSNEFFTFTVEVTCKKCSSIDNVVSISTTETIYEYPFNNSSSLTTSVKGKF